MVNCPICKKENRANPDCNINTDLSVSCETCGSHFKIEDRSEEKIICPRCAYSQDKGIECLKCGVIFAKLKEIELFAAPLDGGNDTEIENRESEKRNKIIKSWIFFSIIYLICVIFYSMVIFPNERDRPKRDRLIATIDLIAFSDFEPQVEAIKDELEDMIDRRVRKSEIYEFFEISTQALEWGVSIKKSNAMIKAKFRNGTILKFVDRNSSVYLIRSEIPHIGLFKFFPSFIGLHTVYKDIDFDEVATELQEENNFLDFSMIEQKYIESMKWFVPRFILFAFLLWIIPVSSGFLAVCFKIRTQSVSY